MKWTKKHRRPEFRDCIQCGDTFEVEPHRGAAKTCSQECSKEHRKRQQREYHANRLKENGAEINARRRSNYAENPEPVRARNAEWEREHRQAVNTGKRTLYARNKGAPVRAWRRRTEGAAHADGA